MLGPISRFDRTGSIILYIQTKDVLSWLEDAKQIIMVILLHSVTFISIWKLELSCKCYWVHINTVICLFTEVYLLFTYALLI